MTRATAPLAGVTVLEVGVFMAGPFATMQLADLGARVIKVENPDGGDPTRASGPFVNGESSPFLRLNRNKESVALDLKSHAGRSAFTALASEADVVVENLRPGAMRRLGLGYDDLSAVNPRLIYASASGWGQDGPLADLPGLDIMAQARGGLMSITGHPGQPPAKVGVPVCDLTAALYLALAITSALHERSRSGLGQHIDVSLLEAGVSLSVWEAGAYFADGTVGGPLGSAHQNHAPYQAVETSDGHVTIGANTQRTWESLCRVLGLEHLVGDPRYATGWERKRHRASLIAQIQEVTRRLSAPELLDLCQGAGVPCAPLQDYAQVYRDPALVDRDFFWDSTHPVAGEVRQLGSPMRFSRSGTVRRDAAPVLGADTRAVVPDPRRAGDASASD